MSLIHRLLTHCIRLHYKVIKALVLISHYCRYHWLFGCWFILLWWLIETQPARDESLLESVSRCDSRRATRTIVNVVLIIIVLRIVQEGRDRQVVVIVFRIKLTTRSYSIEVLMGVSSVKNDFLRVQVHVSCCWR